MKIKVLFHGVLSEYVGSGEAEFALREGSCLGDPLSHVGRRYGGKMPEQLWDREKNAFLNPVWVMRGSEKILNPNETLKIGEGVRFLPKQRGG